MSSTNTRPATLQEMIATAKKLRDEVPEFNPNDVGSKEKIQYFHEAIHKVVLAVQEEVGFANYQQALDFVDNEIAILARFK
jgi:hypothetical protein